MKRPHLGDIYKVYLINELYLKYKKSFKSIIKKANQFFKNDLNTYFSKEPT